MIDISLEFPHTYQIEEILELPGIGDFGFPSIYFPGSKTRPEHDGLWLKVTPATGRTWVGIFAFGYSEPPAISRILSWPDPDWLCVISKGAAYLVSSGEPARWEGLPVLPVLDVRTIPEEGLVILADFTGLISYNRQGLNWKRPRLVWDELKITFMSSETIEGTGYDPTGSERSHFAVDTKTGESKNPPPFASDGSPVW